ncbi:hypothetical protein GH714_008569 [Hevea brasiliensis]|uniref:Uncharacterized protein n=1 Tax=Hevea brasiliensis TaxID=3981 RepID=A0A6A6N983_HEVBR|nr:hypothetical protein GH714_008569 [Hevea brasiliensis]
MFPLARPYSKHKLEPRSRPCVFLGYSQNQSAYLCLDPSSSKIFVSRHVDFVEDQFPFAQLTCFQPRVHENVVQDWVPHYVLPLSHSIPPVLASSSTPSPSTVVPSGINNSSDTTEHLSGNDIKFINQFISKLGHRFSIKDLGSLNYFLGVKVVRTDHGLFLSQRKYIEDIVDRTLMTGAKPVPTPLAVVLGLTRPDIAFAVNKLAQFSATPTVNHWAAVKRVIRYLIGTIDKAYVVFLGKNPISWSSKKQRVVAKSSTEAEYRSISATASELCWIRNLLLELAVPLSKPPVIYCDNLGATYVTTKPIFHSRMKHLEIDYHFVRQLVQLGKLRVSHISSQDQLADVLTKALPRSDFGRFLSKIGVSDQPPS